MRVAIRERSEVRIFPGLPTTVCDAASHPMNDPRQGSAGTTIIRKPFRSGFKKSDCLSGAPRAGSTLASLLLTRSGFQLVPYGQEVAMRAFWKAVEASKLRIGSVEASGFAVFLLSLLLVVKLMLN